jgi:hypothetical protein
VSKLNDEIRCLARLDEVIASNDSVTEFLVAEELITKEERKALRSSADVPKALHAFLTRLRTSKTIQMLEFEWVLLPEERLKLTIITDRNSREFSFNY